MALRYVALAAALAAPADPPDAENQPFWTDLSWSGVAPRRLRGW